MIYLGHLQTLSPGLLSGELLGDSMGGDYGNRDKGYSFKLWSSEDKKVTEGTKGLIWVPGLVTTTMMETFFLSRQPVIHLWDDSFEGLPSGINSSHF